MNDPGPQGPLDLSEISPFVELSPFKLTGAEAVVIRLCLSWVVLHPLPFSFNISSLTTNKECSN